jgi:hypothetical protein
MNYITGENIQLSCDLILGDLEDEWSVAKNPRILSEASNKVIYLQQIYNIINNPYKIFCYIQYLEKLDLLISKLIFFKNRFILIFHNNDTNFEEKHLILFDKLNNLDKIYTQNCNILNKKVIPIPIGIANSMWIHGNLNIVDKIVNMNIKKHRSIYFNFNLNTNQEKRYLCKTVLENKGLKWNNNLLYEDYLMELKSHYYAICPEGNGLDTHRLWECLYLNVIPICLRNPFIEYFKNTLNLDMIILDNWNELILNNLNNISVDNYKKIINYKPI